jgi:hypothetical protein
MMERQNAFADLNEEFQPKPRKSEGKPIDKQAIEKLAEDHGFPSRRPEKTLAQPTIEPRKRRNATGRNKQINIKTTAEAIDLLYKLADAKRVPLGEILENALEALVSKETK